MNNRLSVTASNSVGCKDYTYMGKEQIFGIHLVKFHKALLLSQSESVLKCCGISGINSMDLYLF